MEELEEYEITKGHHLNNFQIQLVQLLKENSRMKIPDISKKIKIPQTTIYDNLAFLKKHYKFTIVKKEVEGKNT